MIDMFELFRQAQGGAVLDNVARAYGMSPEQMRAATAALSPAFAQGFYRNAQTDEGARRFAQMFQTEAHARAFEAHAAALDPATRGAGEDALANLFGSKEVSRAVAAQAAAASGVQAQIIRQVLPVLASILIGGFMKAQQGAATPQSGGFPGPFGDIFGGMFGQKPGQGSASQGPANPFQGWIDAFTGGAGKPAESQAAPQNPMGDMMGEILKGMFGGAGDARQDAEAASRATRPETPRQEDPAPEEPKSPFDDFVEAGQKVSQQNAEAMSQIFDAFFGGEKKEKA